MARVEGKIATGRTRLIEGNRNILKLLACCFGQFFTSGFCEAFNNDRVLTTRLKVAFYDLFLEGG